MNGLWSHGTLPVIGDLRRWRYLRLKILQMIGQLVLPSYRFKWPDMSWWNNQEFTDYLIAFDELGGFNADRRWNLYQLARWSSSVPGETAECGVWKGAGSYAICWAFEATGERRTHHAFDSFAGLSEPNESVDGQHWRKGDLPSDLSATASNLSRYDQVVFHRGWIPERFHEVAGSRFAFVHIDLDLYQPTRDSLEFFYPRLSPGGLLLCDDYGFDVCPGPTAAMDEFFADRPECIVWLSPGAAFVVKA